MLVGKFQFFQFDWYCVAKQLCRLKIGERHLGNFVDSKFFSFSFHSSVMNRIFACLCEVQVRFCLKFCFGV